MATRIKLSTSNKTIKLTTIATHSTLSVSPFESCREYWSSYTLCMKYYFDGNGITETNNMKSTLLSACGPATFSRIYIQTPAQLESIAYNNLVRYDRKPSLIVFFFMCMLRWTQKLNSSFSNHFFASLVSRWMFLKLLSNFLNAQSLTMCWTVCWE